MQRSDPPHLGGVLRCDCERDGGRCCLTGPSWSTCCVRPAEPGRNSAAALARNARIHGELFRNHCREDNIRPDANTDHIVCPFSAQHDRGRWQWKAIDGNLLCGGRVIQLHGRPFCSLYCISHRRSCSAHMQSFAETVVGAVSLTSADLTLLASPPCPSVCCWVRSRSGTGLRS